jgi:secondary thiamine-phosphate synthase enzyme
VVSLKIQKFENWNNDTFHFKLFFMKQKEITLPPLDRGFHLITGIIEREIPDLPQVGLLHIFVKHTSAGLTINENADPSVRKDFENILNRLIPENQSFYTHTDEGADDMPSHVKAAFIGISLTVPITSGKLNLGTWQGIYFCEFRNHPGKRKLVLTVFE